MSSNSDPCHDGTTTIIINGRPKEWPDEAITFVQLVRLAFESAPYGANTLFTVTYNLGHSGKPRGTMVEGDSVRVKEGMLFNVTATDKS